MHVRVMREATSNASISGEKKRARTVAVPLVSSESSKQPQPASQTQRIGDADCEALTQGPVDNNGMEGGGPKQREKKRGEKARGSKGKGSKGGRSKGGESEVEKGESSWKGGGVNDRDTGTTYLLPT